MENRKCQVNLAGIGMGSKGTLTEEVRKIIEESDVLIGATRMLEGFREKKKCCYAEYLPEKSEQSWMSRRKRPDVRCCFPGIPDFTAGQKSWRIF